MCASKWFEMVIEVKGVIWIEDVFDRLCRICWYQLYFFQWFFSFDHDLWSKSPHIWHRTSLYLRTCVHWVGENMTNYIFSHKYDILIDLVSEMVLDSINLVWCALVGKSEVINRQFTMALFLSILKFLHPKWKSLSRCHLAQATYTVEI